MKVFIDQSNVRLIYTSYLYFFDFYAKTNVRSTVSKGVGGMGEAPKSGAALVAASPCQNLDYVEIVFDLSKKS